MYVYPNHYKKVKERKRERDSVEDEANRTTNVMTSQKIRK